jgi:glycerol uptake facilitator-like aquaporin
MRGREAADQLHSGSGWMAGGFVSGILLGLIGTAVTYAIASSSAVQVERVPEGLEASCYRDGYTSKAKGKNTSNALTGGLLGTAVLVLLVVAASSGSSY